MRHGFTLLEAMRHVRGTPVDPFGWLPSRREERAIIREYAGQLRGVLPRLDHSTYRLAVELAALPQEIKGYEQIKSDAIAAWRDRARALLGELDSDPSHSS